MGEIAKIVGGSTPKTTEAAYWSGDVPWITPDDLSGFTGKYIERGRRSITGAGYDSCSTQMVPAGSVLFTSRAPIGYVAIATKPVCTNQGFKSFVCGPDVEPDYVYWYLRSSTDLARSMASGTTFLELSGKAAARIPIPVPPLEYQRRLIAMVEQHMSRLEVAKGALQSARGKSQLLRASLWREAASPSTHDISGWRRVRLPEITMNLDSKRVPVNARERATRLGTVPYYGATGQVGWIDRPLFDEELVLLGEDGAPFLNHTAPKAYRIDGPSWVNNHAHVLRVARGIVSTKYLVLALNAVNYSGYVNGTTRLKLTKSAMDRIEIDLPCPAEQEVLVAEFEARWSSLDAVVACIDQNSRRAAAMGSGILREGFAGRRFTTTVNA